MQNTHPSPTNPQPSSPATKPLFSLIRVSKYWQHIAIPYLFKYCSYIQLKLRSLRQFYDYMKRLQFPEPYHNFPRQGDMGHYITSLALSEDFSSAMDFYYEKLLAALAPNLRRLAIYTDFVWSSLNLCTSLKELICPTNYVHGIGNTQLPPNLERLGLVLSHTKSDNYTIPMSTDDYFGGNPAVNPGYVPIPLKTLKFEYRRGEMILPPNVDNPVAIATSVPIWNYRMEQRDAAVEDAKRLNEVMEAINSLDHLRKLWWETPVHIVARLLSRMDDDFKRGRLDIFYPASPPEEFRTVKDSMYLASVSLFESWPVDTWHAGVEGSLWNGKTVEQPK